MKTDDGSSREMRSSSYHTPVLLPEALELLAVGDGGVYVDATLGGGGYTEAILEASEGAQVYGFDTDPAALAFAGKRLDRFGDRFVAVEENFGRLAELLSERGVQRIDGIVYDLGVSSHQLDTTSIGLSYRIDAPLDMRLDPRLPISALNIIASYDAPQLKQIFKMYGEEPYAGPISRKIVDAREKAPIETTTQLAEIITHGTREDKRNETLSRVFQALRIEVNHELDSLHSSLEQSLEVMKNGARIVVVSYHSLEDRIVKELFKRESSPAFEPGSLGSLKESIDASRVRLRILTKLVTPTSEEVARNPRARSAKLRAAERVLHS